jgi:hypothetical protein
MEHFIRFVLQASHTTTKKGRDFFDHTRPGETPKEVLRRFVEWFNDSFDTDFSLVDNKQDWHRDE